MRNIMEYIGLIGAGKPVTISEDLNHEEFEILLSIIRPKESHFFGRGRTYIVKLVELAYSMR